MLRHAATVLLLRDGPEGVEVLLTRRHQKLAFLGGLWVFPGGALSTTDFSPPTLQRIPPASQAACARLASPYGEPLLREQCLGLSVAACRETFEESGVLLASTADGVPCSQAQTARLQASRRTIAAQPECFASLLKEESLFLEVDRLIYWAHWITPSLAPKRFDTRFFLAAVPPGQTSMIDDVETVEQAWMRPAALVAAKTAGTLPIATPTLCTTIELIAALQEHTTLSALLSAEARRNVIPMMPKILPGTRTVIMPWDPEYPDIPGEGISPEHELPAVLRSLAPRVTYGGS
ncbi:NUDIX hydrolase [Steroidobacter denitrificans]|uniref:NUDIX hydrolase n=1 Tax=Steroidobacter denitrificans TaxID=465721 RepID=UPI00082A7588|nr:hypothetical protein [Steroidobacter denitrificans]